LHHLGQVRQKKERKEDTDDDYFLEMIDNIYF